MTRNEEIVITFFFYLVSLIIILDDGDIISNDSLIVLFSIFLLFFKEVVVRKDGFENKIILITGLYLFILPALGYWLLGKEETINILILYSLFVDLFAHLTRDKFNLRSKIAYLKINTAISRPRTVSRKWKAFILLFLCVLLPFGAVNSKIISVFVFLVPYSISLYNFESDCRDRAFQGKLPSVGFFFRNLGCGNFLRIFSLVWLR